MACTRPFPWTPLRPLILEWELSNHPYKTFVKQRINDLQHGCNLGYLRSQFAHLATNLASASQQPEVIYAALQKECEAGRILGRSRHLLYPIFARLVWALSLNMMEGGELYITSPPLHHTALMIL